MTMVEKIETAMVAEYHDWLKQGREDVPFTRMTLAMLRAMREPSPEMQWAGYRAKDAVFSADALWNRDPGNCFTAMIDAAIVEAEGKGR